MEYVHKGQMKHGIVERHRPKNHMKDFEWNQVILFQFVENTIFLDYEPKPTPAPSGRCWKTADDEFVRHCGANGGFHTVLYNLSPDECLRRCSDEFPECKGAQHYPSFLIWGDKRQTNCWLWSDKGTPCPWGHGALIAGHPGATMIKCEKRKFVYTIISENFPLNISILKNIYENNYCRTLFCYTR